MLRCNDLVAAHLLEKLPGVKAPGGICTCKVLSTKLAKWFALIPAAWEAAIWYTRGQTVEPVGLEYYPELTTNHTTFVPAGFPQINPAGAILGFAAQNPWPRMTCHCMGQIFTLFPCVWQWHLLDIWHLYGHLVLQLFLLAVLVVVSGFTWLLDTLVPHGCLLAAGARLGDSKLWKLSKCLGPKT